MAIILHTAPEKALGLQKLRLSGKVTPKFRGTASFIVRDRPAQIDAPHGISHGERDVLTEGLDYMRGYGPGLIVHVEAGRSAEAKQEVRNLTRRIKSDIALRQRRARMRRLLHMSVFHALARDGSPKFNSHVVAAMPDAEARDRTIESLNGSKVYGKFVEVGPVDDWKNLPGYLLREITPQGAWRKPFRKAYSGSIALGARGGNRVHPSDDLRDILVRKGLIKPYTRTYARRLTERQIQFRDSLFAEPLPLLAAPQRPKVPPRRREKLPPLSLPLTYPPSIVEMLVELGPTHEAVAARVGLSRQQVTNVIHGRFGVSRSIAQRVLKLARAA
jgi:hypothetical protein